MCSVSIGRLPAVHLSSPREAPCRSVQPSAEHLRTAPFFISAFAGNFAPPSGISRQTLASIFFAAVARERVRVVGAPGQSSEPAFR